VSASPPPSYRIDQLTGLRAILAPARAERPLDWGSGDAIDTGEGAGEAAEIREGCPFCEGHEDRTPPETWADRPGGGDPDTPGWVTRAVPNLYPALAPAENGEPGAGGGAAAPPEPQAPRDPLRASLRTAEPDLFGSSAAGGAHEVVVHCPRHRTSMAQLDDGELSAAVAAWRERMRQLAEEAHCLQLIVNEGKSAGASLEHSHAQLYAMDFVPVSLARERERFGAYNERTMGGDLLGDIAAEEVRRRERLVAIDDDAIVLCPWASRGPFELRIVPRAPAARFEEDGEVGVGALATALRALRARLGSGLELNAWVRTAPRGTELFHWHIDISPKLAQKAGFELATGVDINIFPPERAASELREALG
jgi:UDPglucose--hexose-1-phosphate uridylyltransferase